MHGYLAQGIEADIAAQFLNHKRVRFESVDTARNACQARQIQCVNAPVGSAVNHGVSWADKSRIGFLIGMLVA